MSIEKCIFYFTLFFGFCCTASAGVVFQSVCTAKLLQAGNYQHVGNEAQLQLISTQRRQRKHKKKNPQMPSIRPDCHTSCRLLSGTFVKEATATAQVQLAAFFIHLQLAVVTLQRVALAACLK